MPADLVESLRDLASSHSKNHYQPMLNLSRQRIGQVMKDAAREVGIDPARAHPHAFRHTYGRNCVLRGVPIPVLQKWLGHSSMTDTQRYVELAGSHHDQRQLVLPVATTIFAGHMWQSSGTGGAGLVTDQQVALLRQRQMEGKKQQTAAAMAGMSERSARKWQCGPLPSETKQERRWRTRPDPFDGVWDEEILPLLQGEAAGRLRATTIIEWLEEKSPGRFSASQLRTLQRRLQDWRALNGPDQEVYFPQEHPPGREAQLDFTHCNSLGVTLGGRRYRHLLFQLVLSHSGWRYAEVVAGETFVSLKQGLQNALWELGGAPQVIRSDNSSALTHEIKRSRGRALNDNYAELLEHYGLEATLINSGESHENGVAEQAHYRLKDALDQALMLRGSRDFDSAESYTGFVRKVVERRNRLVQGKLEQERPRLQCLPPAPVPEYVNYQARVRKWSTIQAAGRTYTVPSRLIGKEVQLRLYAERLEVYYKGHLVERMERVRGEREANVNYRHVIGSLVRKPGAFARYRFREQMFPTMTFRLAYDALKRWRGERTDVEYVRILHLAATTMESTVDSALALLLEAGEPFDYATVKELANPASPRAPVLSLPGMPDLRVYDSLLAGVA